MLQRTCRCVCLQRPSALTRVCCREYPLSFSIMLNDKVSASTCPPVPHLLRPPHPLCAGKNVAPFHSPQRRRLPHVVRLYLPPPALCLQLSTPCSVCCVARGVTWHVTAVAGVRRCWPQAATSRARVTHSHAAVPYLPRAVEAAGAADGIGGPSVSLATTANFQCFT